MRSIFNIGICLGVLLGLVNGANILGLFPFPTQSHFNTIQILMTTLANNNHNVTSVSSFRLGEKLENYEEIIIPSFDFWTSVQNDLRVKNMFEAAQSSSKNMHKALRNSGAELVDFFLQQPKLKEKLSSIEKFQYDLIIVDLFHTEALLMIGEVFDTPVVALATSNFEGYMSTLLDSAVQSACSPIDFETYTHDATFLERVKNVFQCTERRSNLQKDLNAQDDIARKHFSALGKSLPPLSKTFSRNYITLLNNYSPLLPPRPTVTNIIPVGGIHIKQAQNLQWNIKRFLDAAPEGAIYFSFGKVLKCSDIDSVKLNAIITVIGKLKENVLWHCDLKKVANQPKNLLMQNIVSSSDVLAHPHVKLLMTSGGILSLQEAIFRSVPILGIPVFHDQHINIGIIEKLGVGVRLNFDNLTEASLQWSLNKIINDPLYQTKIRVISSKYRDRPLGAIQSSKFWIEHILRHKDLSHLKTVGVEIPSYELYLVDVIIVFVFMALGLLIIAYLILKAWVLLSKKREENKLYSKLR